MSDIKRSRKTVILNDLGIHARPAAQIAKLAQKANDRIWIVKDDEKADATSIISILALLCTKGTHLSVGIEDESDQDVLNMIIDLIEQGFGET